MKRNSLILMFALVACSDQTPPDPHTGTSTQAVCMQGTTCCPGSPIIIDMAGDGVHLTDADHGVRFQLHKGAMGQWAWTERGSDDSFLVVDVNGNGKIDNGSEMFGDSSLQVTSNDPNGFAALAYYDLPEHGGNGDGWIDEHDPVWPKLMLWTDVDHDGVSAPSELISLDQAGVHRLSVDATRISVFDAYGNESRFVAPIVADAPISQEASDVWLTQEPIAQADICLNQYGCFAWAYAVDTGSAPFSTAPPCSIPSVASFQVVTVSGGKVRDVVTAIHYEDDQASAESDAERELESLTHVFGSAPKCVIVDPPNPDTVNPGGTIKTIVASPSVGQSFEYEVMCAFGMRCSGGGCSGG